MWTDPGTRPVSTKTAARRLRVATRIRACAGLAGVSHGHVLWAQGGSGHGSDSIFTAPTSVWTSMRCVDAGSWSTLTLLAPTEVWTSTA